MEFEVLKVCIDGVDCSGKTTLWNKLHKLSKYRWKLEDRSFVTMLVYARYHNRQKREDYYRQLISDLSNLNHKYVLFNLPFEEIQKRFNERGDHLYGLEELKSIHALYIEIIDEIRDFPNVFVIDQAVDSDELANSVNSWLHSQDNISLPCLIDIIRKRVMHAENKEVSPLRFHFIENNLFSSLEEDILDYAKISLKHPWLKSDTVKEFNEMAQKYFQIIDDELSGKNIYDRKENLSSRRFVFTQQACVSFIQTMIRNNCMRIHVTFRSSDVVDVLPADLDLIYFMAHHVYHKLKENLNLNAEKILFDIALNSAHVVTK